MKITRLALFAALLISPAVAQEANPPALPEYTFTFTQQEILLIAVTLKDRPYKDVADLLTKMQKVIDEQEERAAAKAADDPAEK